MRKISRTSVFKETAGEKLQWPHFLKKKKKVQNSAPNTLQEPIKKKDAINLQPFAYV